MFPVQGALIFDDRYFSLVTATNLKVLGVQQGSNAQAFLTSSIRGFLFYGSDNQVSVTATPSVTLPYVNPAVSGSYPETGTAAAIMIANGADPMNWQFFHAPTTGDWFLMAKGGTFSLQEPGEVPAINQIFADAATSITPELIGFVQTGVDGGGDPVFSARKFAGTGTGEQPLVIRYNGTSGRFDVTGLLDSDTLQHPRMQFNTVFGLNDDGTNTTDGFAVRPDSGITQADVFGLSYDKGTKKVYRDAAHTYAVASSETLSGLFPNNVLTAVSGHLNLGSRIIHYPNVRITAMMRTADVENPVMALFIDGAEVFRYTHLPVPSGATNNGKWLFTFEYLATGLSLGSHTFEIRVQAATSPGGNIARSYISMQTLP